MSDGDEDATEDPCYPRGPPEEDLFDMKAGPWRADHVAEPSPRKRVAEVGGTGGAGNGDLLSVTIHLAKHAIDKDLLDLKGWKRFCRHNRKKHKKLNRLLRQSKLKSTHN